MEEYRFGVDAMVAVVLHVEDEFLMQRCGEWSRVHMEIQSLGGGRILQAVRGWCQVPLKINGPIKIN